MVDVEIRPANEADTANILETLRAALGETSVLRRTPELWAWKHRSNPFGESIVFVAEAEDRIAGVRAFMRWRLGTPGTSTLSCVRPVDTATHPDFHRRGIFRKLTMTALDAARDDGVDLVFNTPNEKSAPGYVKMGWEEVGPIGVMVRPRLGSALPPEESAPPGIERVAPIMEPARSKDLSLVDRPALGLRTPRTPEYLAWRFGSHPTASYGYLHGATGGTVVARAGERQGRSELVVSDLLGLPRARTLWHLSREAKARYLAGWFSPGSPERRVALAGGMLPVPFMNALRLVALPLRELDVDVHDLDSWDISTSDLELL